MRTWMVVVCLVACLAGAAVSSAEEHSVDQMGWLAGHWTGTADGVTNEEHWTSPSGGALIGMHKDVKAGKLAMFEFLRIVTRPDGIYYMASPGGREPTPFMLVEQSAQRVVFENPANGFPQRILYWSDEPNVLMARIEGKVGGKVKSTEWRWTRVAP
jgi:hypothetical protein